AVLACVLLPLGWGRTRDSFPLSNYPMFARDRRSATLIAVYAVAYDRSGGRHWVPPKMVANREVLQARAMLERAGRRKESAAALCSAIAERVAARGEGELAGAVEMRIVRGKHDSIAYFETGELGPERTLASCRVPGR
ncbi:MAG TPA: hypothetical protein VNO33_23955, partial [Kofleriaceae bacterium]|nr:hypothetical protein [Kofleriaceae bacterium]